MHRDFPPDLTVPPLLERFADWLAGIPRGALGYHDGLGGEVFSEWISDDAENLAMARRLGIFLRLAEGSRVALRDHGGDVPAVVLVGPEGELRTLAADLETFLARWSRNGCGVRDLDEPDPGVTVGSVPGPLPAGISFDHSRETLVEQLGPPRGDAPSPLGDRLTWFDPGTDAPLVVDLSPGPDGPSGMPIPAGAIRAVAVRLRSGFAPEPGSGPPDVNRPM